MKKATVVNRFVRGYDLKTAINQLHFNPKKMATELEKLLREVWLHCKNWGMMKIQCILPGYGQVVMVNGGKDWILKEEEDMVLSIIGIFI